MHAELHAKVPFRDRKRFARPGVMRILQPGAYATRRRRRETCASPIDCLPLRTRVAMLEGIATTTSSSAPTPTAQGGICPMLAAHRRGGRTDFLSFARAWDRFAAARGRRAGPPRASCGTLERNLEGAIAAEADRRLRGPTTSPRRSPTTSASRAAAARPGCAPPRPRCDRRTSAAPASERERDLARPARPDELDLRHDAAGRQLAAARGPSPRCPSSGSSPPRRPGP